MKTTEHPQKLGSKAYHVDNTQENEGCRSPTIPTPKARGATLTLNNPIYNMHFYFQPNDKYKFIHFLCY